MSEGENERLSALKRTLQNVHDLAPEVLEAYARLWQLERWLRRMVYVELRALAGDAWETRVKAATKADGARGADKRLTHMPTPDSTIVSYAQLSDLDATMQSEWGLFEPYLPPKRQWDARMDEIKQIRHRVAHFRSVHDDDLPRVNQLLRDLDRGVWHFCTSYNDPCPGPSLSNDPVVPKFLEHDPFPWGQNGDGVWVRTGVRDPNALFGMQVDVLRRPWVKGDWPKAAAGAAGYLYDIHIHAASPRDFNGARFLEDTRRLHPHFVYIHPDRPNAIRLTIPAVLGEQIVSDVIEELIRWIPNALVRTARYDRDEEADARLAAEWPEYVLPPFSDPMSFLCPDNPCSIFGV